MANRKGQKFVNRAFYQQFLIRWYLNFKCEHWVCFEFSRRICDILQIGYWFRFRKLHFNRFTISTSQPTAADKLVCISTFSYRTWELMMWDWYHSGELYNVDLKHTLSTVMMIIYNWFGFLMTKYLLYLLSKEEYFWRGDYDRRFLLSLGRTIDNPRALSKFGIVH